MISFTLNGEQKTFDGDPDTPLLWVIRDAERLTGTKYGCGIAQCGACTMQLDGQPVRSCVLTVAAAAGRQITTIEGLQSPQGVALQHAWVELQVPQCGYCQSGQIMTAAALLAQNPDPSDADIDAAMAGNLCRCGTYNRIKDGIKLAANAIRSTGGTA